MSSSDTTTQRKLNLLSAVLIVRVATLVLSIESEGERARWGSVERGTDGEEEAERGGGKRGTREGEEREEKERGKGEKKGERGRG